MELEKLKFISDIQVNELKKQIEPQQDDLKEKRERIRQVSFCHGCAHFYMHAAHRELKFMLSVYARLESRLPYGFLLQCTAEAVR